MAFSLRRSILTGPATALALLMAPLNVAMAKSAGAPPVAASIHVNQVALERSGPKAAVVDLPEGQSASAFRLVDSTGESVFQAALVATPVFREWGKHRHYYQADFSAFEGSGSFHLEVDTGVGTLKSVPVTIGRQALFAVTAKALLDYFKANRYLDEGDHHIRIFGTNRFVDVWGGWKDAGGDNGKYFSHLSYANFFNPQQTPLVPWALAKSYEAASGRFKAAGLDQALFEEVMWGADYLMRNLDPEGYFYMTVFDRWGTPGAERVVTAYTGIDGVYTRDYRAAFREGGGMAIAALARASRLAREPGGPGAETADRYLTGAERAFAHLDATHGAYCDDGRENIIDDYTALEAAVELYQSTGKPMYLEAARTRAASLEARLGPDGWFIADDGDRPFYHGADAGFPVLALSDYARLEPDAAKADAAKAVIAKALKAQLALTDAVANPFGYARQAFETYDFKHHKLSGKPQVGFFLPHANETGYWWQGESARLASLATAAIVGGRLVMPDAAAAYGVKASLADFAQHQLDWTLGRNPYDICMLYGFGGKNPPASESGGDMDVGGISNGITGAKGSDEGRGITFAPGPDEENWRWVEQWLPHSTWFLLAVSTLSADN